MKAAQKTGIENNLNRMFRYIYKPCFKTGNAGEKQNRKPKLANRKPASVMLTKQSALCNDHPRLSL